VPMHGDEDHYVPGPLGGLLARLASLSAVLGGFVLAAMALLVVISVIGRALFVTPVPGDFEIVGLGTAIAIFLCLPYCYQQRANVAVDIFLRQTPRRVQRVMDAFAALLSALLTGLFAWRMALGLVDTVVFRDISMILGVPLWWAYPFAIASFGLLCVIAVYQLCSDWRVSAVARQGN
jgi:TRAP-type C4-dicarboxylate transport system permease small subunit